MRFIFGLLAASFSQFVISNSQIDSVCENDRLNVAQEDCLALVDFYYSFNVKNYDTRGSWGDADVSTWEGIKVEENRVVSIRLVSVSNSGSGERISGAFKDSFVNLNKLQSLNLWGAEHTGKLPDFWSNFAALKELTLSANKSHYINVFPESVLGLKDLIRLELGGLNIRGKLPKFSAVSKSLTTLKLHGNLFYGEVGDSISELKNLRKLNLSGNRFLWGKFPFEMIENGRLDDLILNSNHFWGDLPDFVLGDVVLEGRRVFFSLGNNHFTNSLGGSWDTHSENGSYTANFGRQSLSGNQEEHEIPISVESIGFGSAALSPKLSGQESKIFIVPDGGYKVDAVIGCKGKLDNSVFYISLDQSDCDAKISFIKCIDNSCNVSMGATNSIANVKMESPSDQKILSGVVQLRGWMLPSQWDDLFDYRDEARGKLFFIEIDGGERQRYYTSSYRDDVTSAMSIQIDEADAFEGDAFIGWSVQVYSGELANGEHNIKLFNSAGLQLESVDFRVFNPLTNGEVKYISGVERTETINDFPVQGHSAEIAFNVAEQSFNVVNQFDSNGVSVRSLERHTLSLERRLDRDPYLRKSRFLNDPAASKIENPQNSKVLSGVQSLRGWLIADSEPEADHSYVDLYSSFFYVPFNKYGTVVQKPLSFQRRQDVNNAFDARGDVGWSFLFYSGLLENGWYDAELIAYRGIYGEKQYKSLLHRVEFLSFTPVNENGEQFYVRSYDKDVLVEDFPYQGGDVTLRFDPAGQNFVMVDQNIH